MSLTDSNVSAKPGTDVGRPHDVHLAVQFLDKVSGKRVDVSFRMPRQATRKADIETILHQLSGAVDQVLNHADESSDAVITLALLRRQHVDANGRDSVDRAERALGVE